MAREKKIMGMPESLFRELERQPCTRNDCGRPAAPRNHPQCDGSVLCHPCIVAIHAEIDAQRKQERATHARCEGCRTRPFTRELLCTDRRVKVCGRCRTRVNGEFHSLALFGPPRVPSAQVLEFLGRA